MVHWAILSAHQRVKDASPRLYVVGCSSCVV